MPSLQDLQPRQRGFTLIEIVIALVLLGILGIVGSRVFTASVYTNQYISNKNMAYASARYALERMNREIREMDLTASRAAANFVANSSELTFIKNGPSGPQPVSFTLNGGTLSMNYGNGAHTLATNLDPSVSQILYFKTIGNDKNSSVEAKSDASDLHYVFIKMQFKPDPNSSKAFTLSNLIYLQNS